VTVRGWRLLACAVALPLPLAALMLPAACTTANAVCDCTSPLVTINIPVDIAASVTGVVLSGPACTGVTPSCANQTNGCTAFDFKANAAGECNIEVDKASGVFTATVKIVAQTGCCAGFYPESASAAIVDVPEPGDGG
jgi:hypothetical protein